MATIRLGRAIRLRRESFGGIAFDAGDGTTVDLDCGAFRILESVLGGVELLVVRNLLVSEGLERPPIHGFDSVVEDLIRLRLVEKTDEVCGDRPLPVYTGLHAWPAVRHLSAPEAVHWAVTYRCNAGCPDCYAAHHRRRTWHELDTPKLLEVVDRIAAWGVFQLAIGGGEPFRHKGLPLIAARARKRGLAVHVTTGLHDAAPDAIEAVLPHLNRLQIGIQYRSVPLAGRDDRQRQLTHAMGSAQRHGVGVGANLVLCKSVLKGFPEIFESLRHAGFKTIVLLRYKPPLSMAQWGNECPSPGEMMGFEEKLTKLMQRNPGTDVRVDCGLSFLQRHLPPVVALRAGIRGCVAGSRIAAIGPDGSMYPCSQLVGHRFRAGNILADDIDDMWRNSAVLGTYRGFRRRKSFLRSLCGRCHSRRMCGGCRALARDAVGGDPGCSESKLLTCPPFPEWLRDRSKPEGGGDHEDIERQKGVSCGPQLDVV